MAAELWLASASRARSAHQGAWDGNGMIAGRSGASRLDEPAVRSAIANLVQKSQERLLFLQESRYSSWKSVPHSLETLLGVISQVIKDRGWCERHRIPANYQTDEVMLAAGFEFVSGEFVLPDDVNTDTLQHLQRVLRAELRELYDPPNERPRLLARLSHLSFHQLAELVASASLRDSTTLAQTEALLTSVDGMPWDSLPALVVSSIAVHLQGADGLTWCAACHAFRAAQPALRVLVINDVGNLELAEGGLPGELAMVLKNEEGDGGAHRIIESISPRHAAELTHLYAALWRDDRPDKPLLLHPERVVGAHLTALRVLVLTHPPRNVELTQFADFVPVHDPGFAAASCQLIQSTASTLHTLEVRARTQLMPDELLAVIPSLGGLSRLWLDLTPFSATSGAAGRPEDTRRVKRLVRTVCTALEEPAHVQCHTRGRRHWTADEAWLLGEQEPPVNDPNLAEEGDSEADV